LQAKWQEKGPQMGNQNVESISVEHHKPEHKLNIVTQSGLATDGGLLHNAKISATEWVRRLTAKSPTFDLQKEKEMSYMYEETSVMQNPLVQSPMKKGKESLASRCTVTPS